MKRWKRAAILARLAMGKSDARRRSPSYWLADEDPLAWWCLTEAIFET
jgi:hypothetical protein